MSTLKLLAFSLIGIYLLGGILLYFLQDRFIFLPRKLDLKFDYQLSVDFEEHFLEQEDGTRLNVLHLKADSSRGLVVYFHGNAGSLERWSKLVLPIVEEGYDVLVMDYRGYGKSGGQRTEENMKRDAERVYNFAKKLRKEEEIVLYGRSLGSAFASHLAGKNNPRLVILETPFYSLADVARYVFPLYPAWLLKFKFNNCIALGQPNMPIVIFHGTADDVVPYSSGKKLADCLSGGNVTLYTIEGGRHNDLAKFEQFSRKLTSTLE